MKIRRLIIRGIDTFHIKNLFAEKEVLMMKHLKKWVVLAGVFAPASAFAWVSASGCEIHAFADFHQILGYVMCEIMNGAPLIPLL
jgi:hypothetical protein